MNPALALSHFSILETQRHASWSPTKVAGLICPPCQAPSSQALTSDRLGRHAKKLPPCRWVGSNGETHGVVEGRPLESRDGLGYQLS